jgi:hypothetical protein
MVFATPAVAAWRELSLLLPGLHFVVKISRQHGGY